MELPLLWDAVTLMWSLYDEILIWVTVSLATYQRSFSANEIILSQWESMLQSSVLSIGWTQTQNDPYMFYRNEDYFLLNGSGFESKSGNEINRT